MNMHTKQQEKCPFSKIIDEYLQSARLMHRKNHTKTFRSGVLLKIKLTLPITTLEMENIRHFDI